MKHSETDAKVYYVSAHNTGMVNIRERFKLCLAISEIAKIMMLLALYCKGLFLYPQTRQSLSAKPEGAAAVILNLYPTVLRITRLLAAIIKHHQLVARKVDGK
jgi:hypothetical protein